MDHEKPTTRILPGVVVGDRFHPNDQELIDFYLKRFILELGFQCSDSPIANLNVYKFEPFQLPGYSKIESVDEWYFISPLEFMDNKRLRCSRKTKTGTWKPTGNPREVFKRGSKEVIGSKRTLVFYENSLKTEWVMHEYHWIPDSDISNAVEFVIVKLKRKPDNKVKKTEFIDPSCMNYDHDTVHTSCNNAEVVSESCKSHHGNEMSVDSLPSRDIQSSVMESELGECKHDDPSIYFVFEDESLMEDQPTNPNSVPETCNVELSIKELKDCVFSVPKIPLISDDQSFVKVSVLDDQSFFRAVGDWRENDNLGANFTTSEMCLETEELATLSEILDLFRSDPSDPNLTENTPIY